MIQTQISPNKAILDKLPDQSYTLVRPLEAVMEYDGAKVLASIAELGIYGEGTTNAEALENLGFELIDLADIVYEEPENLLGHRPRQWKHILDDVLKKCQ